MNRREFLVSGGVFVAGIGIATCWPSLGALADPAPLIDVRLRGAAGDGTTDDSPVIQDAIDEAASQGGGRVYLPPATYLVARQIRVAGDGVEIFGDGEGSILRLADGTLANARGRRHLLKVEGNRFRLHDLTLDGNGENQPVRENLALVQIGVESKNGRDGVQGAPRFADIRISRCSMRSGVTGHIRVNQCDNVTIARNRLISLTEETRHAVNNIALRWVKGFRVVRNECSLGPVPRSFSNNIFVTHSGNSGSGSKHGVVAFNRVDGCTDSPIEASSSTSSSQLDAIVEDVVISHNHVDRGSGIISLQTRDVVIESNVIRHPGRWGGNSWGIRLGCTEHSSRHAKQRGIVVRNNTIDGWNLDGPTTGAGIAVQACGGTVEEVRISRNTLRAIDAPNSAGVVIDVHDQREVKVWGNGFADVAQPVRRL